VRNPDCSAKAHPNSNMLECNVCTAEEADEICVQAAFGLIPDCVEGRVVFSSYVSAFRLIKRGQPSSPFDDKLPIAAALLPWTSTLGELVSGISTSQMPISSNCGFKSSVQLAPLTLAKP
jgi:hypothetical protein